MGNKRDLGGWWRELFRRRRLSLLNTRDNNEVWYTHISVANIITATVAIVIMLFAVVLTLVGYTPILEVLPGYKSEALKSIQHIVETIVRIDSLERVIDKMVLYSNNVSRIMTDMLPISEEMMKSDSVKIATEIILPNSADSLLRAQMESEGRYNVKQIGSSEENVMIAPIDGVITRHFNIAESSYGVEIAAEIGARVMAAQRGLVVISHWTLDSHYIVEIIHPDNTISIYQNVRNAIVKRGDSVRAGEVIGYNGDENVALQDGRPIIFEVWSEGHPIDPEQLITF